VSISSIVNSLNRSNQSLCAFCKRVFRKENSISLLGRGRGGITFLSLHFLLLEICLEELLVSSGLLSGLLDSSKLVSGENSLASESLHANHALDFG